MSGFNNINNTKNEIMNKEKEFKNSNNYYINKKK